MKPIENAASMVKWRREFANDWETSPAYTTALLLCLRFEVAWEAYDRTLPGFMRTDEHFGETWIPCGINARSASLRFAAREKQKLRDAVARIGGIDSATMREAERAVNRMSCKVQIKLLSELEQSASRGEG